MSDTTNEHADIPQSPQVNPRVAGCPVSAPHETPGQPETICAWCKQPTTRHADDCTGLLAGARPLPDDAPDALLLDALEVRARMYLLDPRLLDALARLRSVVHRLEGERDEAQRLYVEACGERDSLAMHPLPAGLQIQTNTFLPSGRLFAHPDTLRMPDAQKLVDDFNAIAASRLTPQDTTDANTASSADRVDGEDRP